jgi:hypothetical protein
MITSDLVIYIQAQLKKNTSKDLIIFNLTEKGWKKEDIEEGFLKVESISKPSDLSPEIKQINNIDKYREIPTLSDDTSLVKPEVNVEIENKIEKEQPKIIDKPKVWAPIKIEPVIQTVPSIFPIEIPKEFHNEEVNKKEVLVEKKEPLKEPISSAPNLSAISFNQPKKTFSDFKTDVSTIKPVYSMTAPEKNITPEIPKSSFNLPPLVVPKALVAEKDLPAQNEIPILSSFKQDLISANLAQGEVVKIKNKNLFKVILIIFIIFLFIGGLTFAFLNDYIKIPSFIKKDPKVILLNTATAFGDLKSYKIETDINISSPSLANITSGLINGEAVVSNDRDSFSINTKGLVNKTPSTPLTINYNSTIKSSLFNDNIQTELKSDGNTAYLKVPNLSTFFDDNYFMAGTIALSENQIKLLTKELSTNTQEKINKFNAFGLFAKIISGSLGGQISTPFKDFINSATMAEKENEIIKGVDSYHYEIVVDRQDTKKLLVAMMDTFSNSNSPDIKNNIQEILGSITVDSFEIWVGKSDNSILQYRFVLGMPLSKIIGFDDKGIADNKVSLDWKTTYYDFDSPNTITMPTDFIKVEDYVKKIHDEKIKNSIISFSSNTKNLFNAEGVFGKRSNKSGSCISPDSGSVFSPLGHSKGSITVVGDIAKNMNDIITLTNGVVSCYSTLSTWSVSTPLESDPQSFFCADNTGEPKILTAQPIGSVCVIPVVKPTTEAIPTETINITTN